MWTTARHRRRGATEIGRLTTDTKGHTIMPATTTAHRRPPRPRARRAPAGGPAPDERRRPPALAVRGGPDFGGAHQRAPRRDGSRARAGRRERAHHVGLFTQLAPVPTGGGAGSRAARRGTHSASSSSTAETYEWLRDEANRPGVWHAPSSELIPPSMMATTITGDPASGGGLLIPTYIPGIMPSPTAPVVVADLFAQGLAARASRGVDERIELHQRRGGRGRGHRETGIGVDVRAESRSATQTGPLDSGQQRNARGHPGDCVLPRRAPGLGVAIVLDRSCCTARAPRARRRK